MEILLGNYKLTTDRYNVIVEKKQTPKRKRSESGGQDYWISYGYYSNFTDAFLALLSFRMKDSDAKTLGELKIALDEASEEIVKTIQVQLEPSVKTAERG
jgi:hypothetical protein|tara:strand:- start:170 stop:469 length:300 start_codon:yes stop_codon:yes gene_type:complete